MESQTALIIVGNEVWEYCQLDKFTWILTSSIFIGAPSEKLGLLPTWLIPVSRPSGSQDDTQSPYPKSHYYCQMGSSSTDKERLLSGMIFQGLTHYILEAKGKKEKQKYVTLLQLTIKEAHSLSRAQSFCSTTFWREPSVQSSFPYSSVFWSFKVFFSFS